MENILTLVIGFALIAFIAWWFFGKQKVAGQRALQKGNRQEITIEVNGGYSPETIILEKGKEARITFDRKDPSTCLDQIVLPEFGIHRDLPLKEETTVVIHPDQAGEFGFACGMNMFKGNIIVE